MLSVNKLTKQYRSANGQSLTVLDQVTFDLAEGDTFAIVGPSGSGKTTLLGLCAGLDRATSGSISLNNIVLDNLSAHKDKTGRFEALVAARGARQIYLPPYSPDFSPIELAFSKLKTALRTAAARTRQALQQALTNAIEWITEQDAKKMV